MWCLEQIIPPFENAGLISRALGMCACCVLITFSYAMGMAGAAPVIPGVLSTLDMSRELCISLIGKV